MWRGRPGRTKEVADKKNRRGISGRLRENFCGSRVWYLSNAKNRKGEKNRGSNMGIPIKNSVAPEGMSTKDVCKMMTLDLGLLRERGEMGEGGESEEWTECVETSLHRAGRAQCSCKGHSVEKRFGINNKLKRTFGG